MVAVSEGRRWNSHTVTLKDGKGDGVLFVDFVRSLRGQKTTCTAKMTGIKGRKPQD